MSASSHSSASQKSLSPTPSMAPPDIPLETLVAHLLASKRSLSSISTLWRANEIITSARAALEESVILGAQTGFLRSGFGEQVRILTTMRSGIERIYTDGQRDFKTVIKSLDAANTRLESTMELLRNTMAESALRPAGEAPRSLLTFVEESSIEVTRDALKESIRESKEAETDFSSSLLSFSDDIHELRSSLSPKAASASPIPNALANLETHAQEMALSLESLSRHFDLCVNAIRHTEGGSAAVRRAASNPEPGSDPVSVSGVMSPLDAASDVEISSAERAAMLEVLENDAAEVEDVVIELRERLLDMETLHETILSHVSSLKSSFKETTSAFELLESVGTRLSHYMAASTDFRQRWSEIKAQIGTQMDELESITAFYASYYSSYNSLLLEIHRRRQAEDKMKSIARKAREAMQKLYDADLKEREEFHELVGEFLPGDLYSSVKAAPARWEVKKLQEEGLVEMSTPELEREVVEEARRRIEDDG